MIPYETPEITVYGAVEDMTLLAGSVLAVDVPYGLHNTAYS